MKKLLSNSKFAGLALGLVALLAITTAAGVNGVFNSVNSALGYQVAGAAGSSGQALCSDGTHYNTACSIPGSGTARTCGARGCYKIEPDGTIFEWVDTGALPDDSTATILLPFSIPTAVISINCTDNGGRVQAGNEFGLGANVTGLSAPYSSFFVLGSATGLNGSCQIVGY